MNKNQMISLPILKNPFLFLKIIYIKQPYVLENFKQKGDEITPWN
jgi:hypothetical protein